MTQQTPARTAVADAPPGSAAPEPAARWRPVDWVALGVLGALLGLFRAEAQLGDSDVLWGSRAGLDMLTSEHVPDRDYYSWTVPGKTWIPNSWGWNLVLGGTYRLGGITAIFILGIALTVLLLFVIGWASSRLGADPARTLMALALVGMLMRFPLYARPQFIDYLVIFVLPALVRRALRDSNARASRAAVLLGLVQIAWMNLHTSAVLGPVVVAAAGCGVFVADGGAPHRDRAAFKVAALTLGSALCCLCTPYGTAPIRHIQEVREASVGYIKEWQPAGLHGSGPIFALVAIAVAVLAGLHAARHRRYDTAAVLVVLAAATATAIRFSPMAVLFAAPEFAVALGRLNLRLVMARRIAAFGCLTVGALVLTGLSHVAQPGNDVWSPHLVGALPHGCRVLNDYGIAGEMLLSRPDVRVSWDGRNDLYGRAVELTVVGYLNNEPGTVAALNANHVNCVLTETSDEIVVTLSRSTEWRVAGTEGSRTLLLRTNP